jgi:hypothetical protein
MRPLRRRRPKVYKLRRELGVPDPPRPSVWTSAALARLDTVPDAVLARGLGASAAYVAQRRQRLGLVAARREQRKEAHA